MAIATRVAGQLGYALVDRQLPVVVAKRMRISRETAFATDETGRSLGARLLSGLELSTPEVTTSRFGETFDEAFAREVQRAVREYAARGNAVIVGRGGGAILGRRVDVLRIFMYAPREWRIERIAGELALDARAAAAEVDRVDRARHAHLRDWYGVEFGAPAIVDLAIDTSTFGPDASADLIVTAVRSR